MYDVKTEMWLLVSKPVKMIPTILDQFSKRQMTSDVESDYVTLVYMSISLSWLTIAETLLFLLKNILYFNNFFFSLLI